MSTATSRRSENEVTILARFLDDDNGLLPEEVARYILDHQLSERDKARMHDLAVRNQEGTLSPDEKEELFAFGRAGSVLSILKSKARQVLNVKTAKATCPW